MRKLKLYSIYTDEMKEVKNIFENSIKDDWDVHIEYWGKGGEGNGDFLSESWRTVVHRKVQFLVAKIKENWGDIIIWSDIDVQFFSKGTHLIQRAIAGKDIVYQAEHWPEKEVNVGFGVIRCNERSLALYNGISSYDIDQLAVADQTAINDMLAKRSVDIKWDVLPNQFWAMSHYLYNNTMPPADVVLHHANCTAPQVINSKNIGSVELKMQQFDLIKKYVFSQRRPEVVK